MTEDVQDVLASSETEEVVQPQQDDQNSIPENDSQEQVVSDKEINFKKLRESKEQLEKEVRELRDHIEGLKKPQNIASDEDLDIQDDEIVEGKVLKKFYHEIKSLKQELNQHKQQTIPDRLKSKFPDIEQVVTQENIEKLKQLEPELFQSITSGTDLYAKGVAAYKTLKAMGIVKEDPYKQQKEEVQKNHSKPSSSQLIKGQSALSHANAFATKGPLTDDMKRQLQKEMEEAIKAF